MRCVTGLSTPRVSAPSGGSEPSARHLRGDGSGRLHGVTRSLHRQRRLPGPPAHLPPRCEGLSGLGDHRLQHRVRVVARHRRSHRRPYRPPPGVLRGIGRVQRGIRTVRTGSVGEPSGRRSAGPGRRGGRHAARVVGVAPRCLSDRAAFPGRGDVGRGGSPGGGHRSLPRSGAHLGRRMAMGVLRQLAGRSPGVAAGSAGLGRLQVRRGAGTPRLPGGRAGELGVGEPWCWPSRRARAGAGPVAGWWRASSLPPSSAQRSCTARPTTPHRSWT